MARAFFLAVLLAGASNPSSAPPAPTAPDAAPAASEPAPTPPDSTANAASPIPGFREVAPGVLEYHGVRLDKKNRRISFPAVVNQQQGLIEYLLVNDKGKTHESLFATKVEPHDIHLALLLIGLKDKDPAAQAKETAPPSAIDSAYLQAEPKLEGAPVRIAVSWTQGGKAREIPAEEWILDLQTGHRMTDGPWTYNGSLIQDGVFLADQEDSIVSVITDPTALVNNPRPGYDNDEIWQVRQEVVPPENTPVELNITLPEPAAVKP
jgi:hypothetical protein